MAAHSVFTIVANIIPERLDALEKVLATVQADVDGAFALPNPRFDFRALRKLHFASFVIFDRDEPEPFLVFENSVDDSAEEYLGELMSWVGLGMDAVFENCVGYRVKSSAEAKLKYLADHLHRSHLHHVGTAYRTVSSILRDRELRGQLDARLDTLVEPAKRATTEVSSPSSVWQKLQCEFRVAPGREGRALERIKNWTIMLSPIPVLAVAIALLWDRHWYLIGFLALLFALKALWLVTLVGWPMEGKVKTAGWFVLAASAGGLFLGVWPWVHAVPMYTAGVVLGALGVLAIARALPVRMARQTRRNWPIVPLLVLAAALSWLPVVVVHKILIWIRVDWPLWLDVPGIFAVAMVFVAAFVGLVFVSAMPESSRRLPAIRYAIILIGGGVGALLFWAVANIGWWSHALGALVLAAVSLMELFALWDIPLPSPKISVNAISAPKLNALEIQEDKDVQNHMAVLVRIRPPHRVRSFLLILFLRTLDLVFYRTVLPDTWYRSTLFGIPTVHFAQWTVLDRTRHIFLSNYDLSWSVYLNDFGEHLTNGIQKIWGQSEECPGVADLGEFKQFVRTKMVPYQVWYRAYPGLTAEQIMNNEQIRLGLSKTQKDDKACAELLRRLSHIERA